MKNNNNFYISTSIAYVNGVPHLGHALEDILADTINRSQKMFGKDTFFLTGTDEHGIKIFKKAEELGISAQEMCDNNSEKFKDLKKNLNISYDDFVRTTDQKKHWPSVQKLWQKLEENGDIYKKQYEGKYCEGCEVYLSDKELEDGKCPIHKKEPVSISEENYFFRLSKYSDKILKLIQNDELKIIPSFRKNEILKLLEGEGLKDVSFSRPAKSLPWGVPVPGNEEQNMYVWCDALTNYISALGYACHCEEGNDVAIQSKDTKNEKNNNLGKNNLSLDKNGNTSVDCHVASFSQGQEDLFQKYWQNGTTMHSIGKDIVRFHAGIWIGMLLSAGIKTPDYIHIHGFLTSNGEKMSKSTGNVVDPVEYIEKYGSERLRYFLLREVPTGRDGDFTHSQFVNICNAHLSNGLGNLVNRVSVMSKKNGVEKSGKITLENFEEKISETWKNFEEKMKNFDTQNALVEAWELVEFGNKQMDELKPWIVKKEDEEKFSEIMKNFLELIKEIGKILAPFVPETSEKILKIYESLEPEILFERIED